jgi:DNA-binding response OmpR family regulator
LQRGLTEEGYAADLALDGEEALWLAENNPYDVIILDVMMPPGASASYQFVTRGYRWLLLNWEIFLPRLRTN